MSEKKDKTSEGQPTKPTSTPERPTKEIRRELPSQLGRIGDKVAEYHVEGPDAPPDPTTSSGQEGSESDTKGTSEGDS